MAFPEPLLGCGNKLLCVADLAAGEGTYDCVAPQSGLRSSRFQLDSLVKETDETTKISGQKGNRYRHED
jgi:hypothetical protein